MRVFARLWSFSKEYEKAFQAVRIACLWCGDPGSRVGPRSVRFAAITPERLGCLAVRRAVPDRRWIEGHQGAKLAGSRSDDGRRDEHDTVSPSRRRNRAETQIADQAVRTSDRLEPEPDSGRDRHQPGNGRSRSRSACRAGSRGRDAARNRRSRASLSSRSITVSLGSGAVSVRARAQRGGSTPPRRSPTATHRLSGPEGQAGSALHTGLTLR